MLRSLEHLLLDHGVNFVQNSSLGIEFLQEILHTGLVHVPLTLDVADQLLDVAPLGGAAATATTCLTASSSSSGIGLGQQDGLVLLQLRDLVQM